MRVIVQRAIDASCIIDNKIVSNIDHGFMILVGFTQTDTDKDLVKIAKKVQGLRIFEDEDGKINKSLFDVKGEILSISQFTLYASCKKGYRPSFTNAMSGDLAIELYKKFNKYLRGYGLKVYEGVFGADMNIKFVNVGPTTIILDSKEL